MRHFRPFSQLRLSDSNDAAGTGWQAMGCSGSNVCVRKRTAVRVDARQRRMRRIGS